MVNENFPLIDAHYMIFDKAGTALTGSLALSSLWVAAQAPADDPCRTQFQGDPYVLYDHLADRWLMSQMANLTPNTTLQVECIAISQGPNPVTDGWFVYTFRLGVPNDYPKIGIWPDGYYMISQEDNYPTAPLDATVFDRANMLNGNPATFQRKSFASPTIIMLPSDLTGPPPVPGTPNIYVRPIDGALFGGSDRIEIFEFHVDWGVPASTTFTLVQTLTPAPFSSDICAGSALRPQCIEQPTSTLKLEEISVWPMGPLQYRNFGTHETLVFNHVVNVDGTGLAGSRWYELRRSGASWSIFQQGTFSPPDGQRIHRWMGSIAMDKAGNMALGYSVSNNGVASTVFPGIRYAGRLATDPPGELPFGEVTLVNGQTASLAFRWGDYSAMRLDPVDGCTFWYTTEYTPADASQLTRIGAFRFPTCNPADLAIAKAADRVVVAPGGDLFYTITVTNLGPDRATDVVVTDTLPAGVTFVVATDDCAQGPPSSLTCRLGDLADGQTVSFIVKVRVKADPVIFVGGATTITNSATVTSTQFDPDHTNNTAKVTTIVEKQKKRKEW
jgi:uncharacterized repeat protein (TIGR01451 family)